MNANQSSVKGEGQGTPHTTGTNGGQTVSGTIEQKASHLRSKVEDTMGDLGRRVPEVFDAQHIRDNPLPFVLAGVGITLAVAGTVGILLYRASRETPFERGWKQARRYWNDPAKLAKLFT